MGDYEYYEKKAKSILSEKRFIHSLNVSKLAEKIAICYGIDLKKVKIAGILHDICKEMDKETLLELLSEANPKIFTDFKDFHFKLYHGPAATVYLRKEFGVDDDEILNAVCFHTTGRKNMTLMEKIIAIADHSSDERPFDDVKEMQELAMKDINKAILIKYSLEIKKCINKAMLIHPYMVETYNDMIREENK